jgi:cytochrome b561
MSEALQGFLVLFAMIGGLFALMYIRDLRRDRFPVPPPAYQQPTIIIQRRVGCLGHFAFGFIIAIVVIIGLIASGGK